MADMTATGGVAAAGFGGSLSTASALLAQQLARERASAGLALSCSVLDRCSAPGATDFLRLRLTTSSSRGCSKEPCDVEGPAELQEGAYLMALLIQSQVNSSYVPAVASVPGRRQGGAFVGLAHCALLGQPALEDIQPWSEAVLLSRLYGDPLRPLRELIAAAESWLRQVGDDAPAEAAATSDGEAAAHWSRWIASAAPGELPASAPPPELYTFAHRGAASVAVQQRRGRGQGFDVDTTGDLVWPTAIVFCHYLCDHPQLLAGRRVLDLGAGTGLVGLVAAAMGASVTLTDVPRVLPLLTQNVAGATAGCWRSPSAHTTPALAGAAQVRPLYWGDRHDMDRLLAEGGPFDVVLCCEVVYQQPPAVLDSLRQTIRELLLPSEGTLVFAYQQRDGAEMSDSLFFRSLESDGFSEIPCEALTAWDDAWDDTIDRVVRAYRAAPPAAASTTSASPAAAAL